MADWTLEQIKFIEKLTEEAMPALREATENCPACILAALRQARIPTRFVESFDFKKEIDDALQCYKDDQAEQAYQWVYL